MKRRHVLKATGTSVVAGLALAGSAGAQETGTDDVETSASCGDCEREECSCEWYGPNGECQSWDCECVFDCSPDHCPCPT